MLSAVTIRPSCAPDVLVVPEPGVVVVLFNKLQPDTISATSSSPSVPRRVASSRIISSISFLDRLSASSFRYCVTVKHGSCQASFFLLVVGGFAAHHQQKEIRLEGLRPSKPPA